MKAGYSFKKMFEGSWSLRSLVKIAISSAKAQIYEHLIAPTSFNKGYRVFKVERKHLSLASSYDFASYSSRLNNLV